MKISLLLNWNLNFPPTFSLRFLIACSKLIQKCFFQMLLSLNYEYCARASSRLRQRGRHTFTHLSHISLWALSYNSVFVTHLKLMSLVTHFSIHHIFVFTNLTHVLKVLSHKKYLVRISMLNNECDVLVRWTVSK